MLDCVLSLYIIFYATIHAKKICQGSLATKDWFDKSVWHTIEHGVTFPFILIFCQICALPFHYHVRTFQHRSRLFFRIRGNNIEQNNKSRRLSQNYFLIKLWMSFLRLSPVIINSWCGIRAANALNRIHGSILINSSPRLDNHTSFQPII